MLRRSSGGARADACSEVYKCGSAIVRVRAGVYGRPDTHQDARQGPRGTAPARTRVRALTWTLASAYPHGRPPARSSVLGHVHPDAGVRERFDETTVDH